jgi:cell division protein FtsQ
VLQVEKGSPILAFNPHDALKRLGDISWVKSGIVERRLPSTIFVRLYEREPIAIWQNNKVIKLVDREGHVLRDISKDEVPSLPLVVGEGANTHAADLIAQLLQYQSILTPLRAAVRVSDRRWDLHMNNNIIVKLPEENIGAALERLHKAITEQQVMERNIIALDFRLPDRMIIETNDPAQPPKPAKTDSKI